MAPDEHNSLLPLARPRRLAMVSHTVLRAILPALQKFAYAFIEGRAPYLPECAGIWQLDTDRPDRVLCWQLLLGAHRVEAVFREILSVCCVYCESPKKMEHILYVSVVLGEGHEHAV